MSKIIVYVAIAVVVFGSIGVYIAKIKSDERAKVLAEQIAKSNQNIAERRIQDATFNKMDAAALCRDAGLSWVYADGKSHCE